LGGATPDWSRRTRHNVHEIADIRGVRGPDNRDVSAAPDQRSATHMGRRSWRRGPHDHRYSNRHMPNGFREVPCWAESLNRMSVSCTGARSERGLQCVAVFRCLARRPSFTPLT
jgi:hypothetical protein